MKIDDLEFPEDIKLTLRQSLKKQDIFNENYQESPQKLLISTRNMQNINDFNLNELEDDYYLNVDFKQKYRMSNN